MSAAARLGAALIAAVLVAPPAAASGDDAEPAAAAATAPPPATRVGLDARLGLVRHTNRAVDSAEAPLLLGAEAFLRHGWLRLGLAAELHPMDYQRSGGWLPPGETWITRQDQVTAASAGVSLPGALAGGGWLLQRLRADVLGEVGVSHTRIYEDLGVGVGNRHLDRWTPVAGARLGVSMHLGGRFNGFWGVAAFYRHALRQDRFTAATGRREPVLGDSAGVVLFGGADLRLR